MAMALLASDKGATAELKLLSYAPVDWPDASLGCPEPGHSYGQVITPGFLVRVRVRGETWEYHTDGKRVVRCP